MAAAYDDSNVFAKILRGELPSHRVYEDEATVAFMDVMPQVPGHTLVVPRKPSRNLLDADGAHEEEPILRMGPITTPLSR